MGRNTCTPFSISLLAFSSLSLLSFRLLMHLKGLQISVCLFTSVLLSPQDIRQLTIRILTHCVSHKETTSLTFQLIPRKNSETRPPFLRLIDGASFG